MSSKKFIWLDEKAYPEYKRGRFCVAEFKKEIDVQGELEIDITAHSRYMLFVDGEYIGRGPASVGGDYFLLGEKIKSPFYETYTISKNGKVEIKVLVTSVPTAMTEYDFGVSGFWVEVFSNGEMICQADESWDARLLFEREDVLHTDYTKVSAFNCKAKFIKEKFDVVKSPLEHLTEERIYPSKFDKIVVEKKKSAEACLFFDKIYSAYPHITISCQGKCKVTLVSSEEGTAGVFRETVITDKSVHHFSPRMRSIGQIAIEVENESDYPVIVENVYIDYVHYPVHTEGEFVCSDELINKIYDVCMHTLKICRQTIHLDSPTHQEPLACTGDYYIQSMIEYLSLQDPTLAEWDLKRTALILKLQNGRMFHTTYSLIYPWWAYEHYMYTGDKSVIDQEAIKLLLDRFEGYISHENGLLEYAPDYVFVDWVVADTDKDAFLDGGKMMSHGKMEGFSLHHPPKALGQSVLCLFYYNALVKIAKLYEALGNTEDMRACLEKAERIKESINTHLFDKEKGLYVGGLNTPNKVPENDWLPKNTSTVYYLKQANVLAVLFGVAPKEKRKAILEYVVKDLSKLEMQPYFYHFLLNALYNEGMFGDYGFDLIRRYESLIDRCDKGLSEAWENMQCDYSHAWGAAPAYALKRVLSGFEILEAGCKKIRLSPELFSLDMAKYQITTPYGKIEFCQKKGEEVSVKAPKEIEII